MDWCCLMAGGRDTFFFLAANVPERNSNAKSNIAHAPQQRSTKQRKKEITARVL